MLVCKEFHEESEFVYSLNGKPAMLGAQNIPFPIPNTTGNMWGKTPRKIYKEIQTDNELPLHHQMTNRNTPGTYQ